jgi:hypothetical protein
MKTLALLPLALLAAPLAAAPLAPERLDKTCLPADVRWFAHVDLEALARSELYAALSEGGTLRLEDEVDELAELGLDPLKDLTSVTLFCASADDEDGILLLNGNARVDAALEKLKAKDGYRADTLDGRTVHAWGDGGDAWYAAVLRRDGSEERMVVQGHSKRALKAACEVLTGQAKNLAQVAEPRMKAEPAPGSIVFVAASEKLSELAGVEVASSLVQLAEDLVLDVGETRGELFATLVIETKDEREARQVQQVLQGAVALVGLMAGEEPELAEVLQDLTGGLRVAARGKTLEAEFRMPVQVLLRDLRRLEALDAEDDEDEDGENK